MKSLHEREVAIMVDNDMKRLVKEHCIHGDDVRCDECSGHRLHAVFGRKHALHVLRIIIDKGPVRFTAIQKAVGGSPKTITERLRDFMGVGIIERKAYAEIPPRVEYELTEKGRDLAPMMAAFKKWMEKWGAGEGPLVS